MKAAGFKYLDDSAQTQAGFYIPVISDAVDCVLDHDVNKCVGAFFGPAGAPLVNVVGLVGGTTQPTDLFIPREFTTAISDGVQLVDDTIQTGETILGGIDEFVSGKVTAHMNLDVMSDDPLFTSSWPMLRGWGTRPSPNTSAKLDVKKIVPHGATAEITQLLWGYFPTTHTAHIASDGSFDIPVAKNTEGVTAPLCIKLENAAARISTTYTADEFCNFGGLDSIWDGFRHDIPAPDDPYGRTVQRVQVSAPKLNALTQITDGWDYMNQVVGRTPRQAQVSVGPAANLIGGFNTQRPFVPCLSFPEMKDSVFQILGAVGASASVSPAGFILPALAPLVGPIAGTVGIFGVPLFEKDMFLMADSPDWPTSRGVVSHEYGHFVMCDAFHEARQSALTGLYATLLLEGLDQSSRYKNTGVMMESFADFFASQVVGGVNYTAPVTGSDFSLAMSYCTGGPAPATSPICVESNFRGVNDSATGKEFYDEVSRRMTTYYDAFDSWPDDWRDVPHQDVPTNGDPWTEYVDSSGAPISPRRLIESLTGYMPDLDDVVELPGAAVEEWLSDACAEPAQGDGVTMIGFLAGLANTMMQRHGVSWCDACDMFVKHDRDFDSSAAGVHLRDIWMACNEGELRDILGPPPDPDLRMDISRGIESGKNCLVCTGNQFSNQDGYCEACPVGQIVVHNVCEPCPAGQIQVDNECQACGPRDIVVNNACVSCPGAQVPELVTNTCVDCPADANVDWSTMVSPGCGTSWLSDVASTSASVLGSSDPCPNFFVADVTGLSNIGASTTGASSLNVEATGYVGGTIQDSECPLQTEDYLGHTELLLGTSQVSDTPLNLSVQGELCNPQFNTCPNTCWFPRTTLVHVPSSTFDSSADTLRLVLRTDHLTSPKTDLVVWTQDQCVVPQ